MAILVTAGIEYEEVVVPGEAEYEVNDRSL